MEGSELKEMNRVLITGGTGSFGQAMVDFLLANTAVDIVIYSRDELKQHDMQQAMRGKNGAERLRFFLGDVRDQERLWLALEGVDTVIHAAALKQVPAMEYNPMEAVKTNAMGTWNLIQAVLGHQHAIDVIGLSTDKAVAPANLYGATKMVAERLLINANGLSGTRRHRFSVVRYGNVINSRGSALPIFRKSARVEKVIRVTDPSMTRFVITLEQATSFVYSSILSMEGGEIFVPFLKKIHLGHMAKCIAAEHSARIEVIGRRPGEKVSEVLVSREEMPQAVYGGRDFVVLSDYCRDAWPSPNTAGEYWEYSSDSAEEIDDATYQQLVVE
jgi:UDP-N-acetylglucosamine 4,6-dehydratase